MRTELEANEAVLGTTGLTIDEVFRNLDSEALEVFGALQVKSFHPPGTALFAEGQMPAGILFLCAGRVRVFMSCRGGQCLISRTAQPGELLGITEGILGDSYNMSAETVTSSEVGFINREDFLMFLHNYGAVAFRLVQLLSDKLDSSYEYLRSFAATRSRKPKRLWGSNLSRLTFRA